MKNKETHEDARYEITKIMERRDNLIELLDRQLEILIERDNAVFKNDDLDNEDYCTKEEELKEIASEIESAARFIARATTDRVLYKLGGANIKEVIDEHYELKDMFKAR